ncbi:TonB-dependent receptor [Bacteroides coprosuis DSM 18011]|uniref:TonB-dependent receptor n=1 Tax=Bacteroides coprosuis DSM 18011 TaxID=679937 RepID=F3ZUZ5_9BACE|nr:TonB-dependent receptor plug domain-containing protein [Bacteroides coprosuis]EGJ72453.1 TonB-dependent receptor [Bacteroides coprosuis DSM 18011]
MKQIVFIAFFSVLVLNGFAQKKDSVAYGLNLDEVQIVARRIQHANEANAGAKVSHIEPQLLQINKTRSFSELLTDNSATYIKSLGTGALSTASFRGGSAAQTRVNWNGINITPPMSGVFDFSQFPVFFADNVNLYYGSSHVKSGTGAVGGSVNIFNDPDWNKGVTGKAFGEYGSYNTYTGGGQVNFGGSQIATKTRLFYQHSDNDYTYINKVLTSDQFREKREDAEYSQFGVIQEGYFKPTRYTQLTVIGWLQQGKRMLPQPLGIVGKTHEQQHEKNVRGYFGFDYVRGIHEFHLKGAWLYYRLKYDKWFDGGLFDPEGNINSSKTWQGVADYSCAPIDELVLNTTLTYTHDQINVSSYIDVDSAKYIIDNTYYHIPEPDPPLRHYRNVLSWQMSARWSPLRWLQLHGQYMFEQNNRKNVSTWTAGFATNFFDKSFYIKGSISYNYRFPSMNDLYWRPGGNPDVKPEDGYSYDASIGYKKKLASWITLNAEASGYIMYIDNWILWLPKDGNQWIWTPQNKRNVLSTGAEFAGKLELKFGELKTSLSGNFSWARSRTRKRQHIDDNSYMKQIPYVPEFKWNSRLAFDYKRAFCSWQTTYIGKRFVTTDESYSTRPYTIHNLLFGYQWNLKGGVQLSPQIRIDNILDTYYESTQYYPMPLRNVLCSIMIEF